MSKDSPAKTKSHHNDEDAKLLCENTRLYAPPPHDHGAQAAYFIEEITGDRTWYSTLAFEWFSPLITLGNTRHLTVSDVFPLKDDHLSAKIAPLLQATWTEERSRQGRNASLSWALLRVFGGRFAAIGAAKLVHDALAITVPPLILKMVVEYQLNATASAVEGIFNALFVVVSGVALALLGRHYEYFASELAVFVRASVATVAFQHTLAVSPSTLQRLSADEIVDDVATETAQLQHGLLTLYSTLGGVLQLFLGGVMLWHLVGNALWAGLITLILGVPCMVAADAISHRHEAPLEEAKQEREQLCQELLTGIKTLKLLAWERSFAGRVMELRDTELRRLKSYLFAVSCKKALAVFVPVLVAIATLVAFTLLVQGPLTIPTTATTLLVIVLLMRGPVKELPQLVMKLIGAFRSLRTLNEFLNEPERVAAIVSTRLTAVGLVLKNADFKWDTAQPKTELDELLEAEGILQNTNHCGPVLHHINLYAAPGEIHAIVGGAEAGKSTLLAGIAGLARCTAGEVAVKGSVAYVGREPFLLSASIRENICFGKPFDADRYFEAIRASGLKYDLRGMARGDRTEVGSDEGVSLTPSQRIRVALARSVYHNADIYILDEILTGMDALIIKKIIKKCLLTALKGKIVIMATQSLKVLKKCTNVVVLGRGTIIEAGNFKQLLANKKWSVLSEFVRNDTSHKNRTKEQEAECDEDSDGDTHSDDVDSDTEALAAMISLKELAPVVAETMTESPQADEDSSDENVRTAVALWLVRSLGERGYVAYGIFVVLYLAASVFRFFSLSRITEPGTPRDVLEGYIGFSVLYVLVAVSALAGLHHGCLHACHSIFHTLLDRLARAPMAFYDTTANGRVGPRLAKDVAIVEAGLVKTWPHLFSSTAQLLVVFGVLMAVSPWLIFAFAPLILGFYRLEECFGTPARDLDRVEACTVAPIKSCIAEVLSGMTAIRQYKAEHLFFGQFQERLDKSHQAFLFQACASCWLGLRVDGIYIALLTCVTLASVHVHAATETAALHAAGKISVAFILSLSLSPVLVEFLHACDQTWFTLVAGGRVKAHSKMPIEASLDSNSELPPPSDWPSAGKIEFENVSIRYRQGLPRIVRGASFTVAAGESVSIIGRSGSGKKTLFAAITRLVELTTGTITIDGVDISKVGLHDLRRKVTLVSPDPVLFAGSIRLNLDASNRFSDDEIWTALRKAKLQDAVLSLDETVNEKASNYSLGERQLLSLARVLLRKPKVILVDQGEWLPAVGLVGSEMDQVEQCLRQEFPSATRLTITNRLATLTEATHVLVMDNGQVVEYGTPKELQRNSKSFYKATLEEWKRRDKEDRKKT